MTDNYKLFSGLNLLFYIVLPLVGTLIILTILGILWWNLSHTAADRRALSLIFKLDSSAADLDEELLLGGKDEEDYPQRILNKKAEARPVNQVEQADIVECQHDQVIEKGEIKEGRMFLSHGRAPARFKSVTRLQRIAIALAGECYFKFGRRPQSEANMLITRKWLRDRMEEVENMRKKDAASVIDIALVLSFYPSVEAREMDEHLSTAVSANRMGRVSNSLWYRFKAWLEVSGTVSTANLEPRP